MLIQFVEDGQLRQFNSEDATLLADLSRGAGAGQAKWIEVYQLPDGRFVEVHRFDRPGKEEPEAETVFDASFIDLGKVIRVLAAASEEQRSEAGNALLARHGPADVAAG